MERPNHLARAARVWDVLTDYAARRELLTYGHLGGKTGIHARALKYALEPIQDYCIERGLPPLTILVRSVDGELGGGFVAWPRDRLEEGTEEVFSYPWGSEENPFSVWRDGETMEGLISEVIETPHRAPEVFARVRVRGTQQTVFRELIFRIYEGECAVSGSRVAEGLDACHIVGWNEATSDEAFSPGNGILMHVWYHRLFDAGLFDVDDQYHIRVPAALLKDSAVADRQALIAIADRRLRLPTNRALWPSTDLLSKRRASNSAG